MNINRKKLWWIIPFFIILLLISGGCRHIAANKARDAWVAKLDSMLGMSIDQVALNLGPPTSRTHVGRYEVWIYHYSYGIMSSGHAHAYSNPYIHTTTASGSGGTWEAYDRINIYFDNATFVNYTTGVQLRKVLGFVGRSF